ncbi:hypothetical protein DPEC_G00134990 [Dallia pectoralis]|uniref:Uncharacterized protein n=1 Tax=Dallia pectoralis TaxID=75939 RepID=A0ACC2GRX2_DALPE|nr:hypothetical protein DPEC_G00134990 [Dallia pectoralis]
MGLQVVPISGLMCTGLRRLVSSSGRPDHCGGSRSSELQAHGVLGVSRPCEFSNFLTALRGLKFRPQSHPSFPTTISYGCHLLNQIPATPRWRPALRKLALPRQRACHKVGQQAVAPELWQPGISVRSPVILVIPLKLMLPLLHGERLSNLTAEPVVSCLLKLGIREDTGQVPAGQFLHVLNGLIMKHYMGHGLSERYLEEQRSFTSYSARNTPGVGNPPSARSDDLSQSPPLRYRRQTAETPA